MLLRRLLLLLDIDSLNVSFGLYRMNHRNQSCFRVKCRRCFDFFWRLWYLPFDNHHISNPFPLLYLLRSYQGSRTFFICILLRIQLLFIPYQVTRCKSLLRNLLRVKFLVHYWIYFIFFTIEKILLFYLALDHVLWLFLRVMLSILLVSYAVEPAMMFIVHLPIILLQGINTILETPIFCFTFIILIFLA